jgi:hypothetical protein
MIVAARAQGVALVGGEGLHLPGQPGVAALAVGLEQPAALGRGGQDHLPAVGGVGGRVTRPASSSDATMRVMDGGRTYSWLASSPRSARRAGRGTRARRSGWSLRVVPRSRRSRGRASSPRPGGAGEGWTVVVGTIVSLRHESC